MKKILKVICANCGNEIEPDRYEEIYMFTDNYLIVKYFDDYKSNRFCSQACACDFLGLETIQRKDLPKDKDDEYKEIESWEGTNE